MHRKTLRRTVAAFAVSGTAVLALSACSPAVDVTAANDAANPACAPMMVALPDTIGDAGLRKTNSQATAAWATHRRSSSGAGSTYRAPPRTVASL